MQVYRLAFKAMGGPAEIQLAATDEASAHQLARPAIDEVMRLEAKYSRYRADSIISQINAAAGAHPVAVDDETWSLLAYADQLYTQSQGLFDISSGVLRRAWDFRSGRLPTQVEIDTARALVGWEQVVREQHRVYLPRPGMEIDFGGFGKEYAVDRAAAALQQQGVQHALVNLSGDARALGPKPDGTPWAMGVQHPRDAARLLATVPLHSGALTTSGDYERYLIHEGQRYCHLLHPHTGWPVGHWQSVSLLAPTALLAGSLSSIAMLMAQPGLTLLQNSGMQYLAVDGDGHVHAGSPSSRQN